MCPSTKDTCSSGAGDYNRPHPARLFGVALDVTDDPFSLQLKLASMWAQQQGQRLHEDPYEAMIEQLMVDGGKIQPAGRFPLPSWMGPMPQPADRLLVTQERMRKFLDDDGPLKLANEIRDFVAEKILPEFPVMVGIDHSATGGVVSALSEALGPENLTVLVLDHHFDALPLSLRMEPVSKKMSVHPTGAENLFHGPLSDDRYCCGNFCAYLIDKNLVLPEHLLFIGVADYPAEEVPPEWEMFRDAYLAFETQGCGFFPLWEFRGKYEKKFERFLAEKITTPYLYVSLDLDVGAYRCVHAARYMDGPGVEEKALAHVAHLIAKACRTGRFRIVGLDVMEFNMHLLGITTKDGVEDKTLQVACDFIRALTVA